MSTAAVGAVASVHRRRGSSKIRLLSRHYAGGQGRQLQRRLRFAELTATAVDLTPNLDLKSKVHPTSA